ncbi:MAG: HigA family addiction module antitoxin [Fervidobacterium sp.]
MRFESSEKTVAIPPGATILEQLETRGMTQKEFAKRMGMSEKHISRLINGHVELTQDMALRLESVLGVPASFWNNLEAIYREKLERVRKEKELEEEAKMVEHFPYSKMVTLGWIAPATDKKERVYNLRRFFEVASLNLLENLNVPGIAYRRTGRNEKSDYNLAVWAQKARLDARKIKTEPINIAKLEQSVERIRAMTMEDPETFSKELVDLLAGCGVALVFLPQIDGSFLHGASFYDGNHIVMGLTLRGSYADIFWFSFFHELCHIIRGHINNSAMATEEQEEEANTYARDVLIPPEEYKRLVDVKCFTRKCIITFAQEIGIASGIVLGRLQREGYVPYNKYNTLKVKYKINGQHDTAA